MCRDLRYIRSRAALNIRPRSKITLTRAGLTKRQAHGFSNVKPGKNYKMQPSTLEKAKRPCWQSVQRALQAFALLILALAGQAVLAQAARPIQIWPTIPFVRGKDLCQYQENYAKTKNEQSKDMLQNVVALIREGAKEAVAFGIVQAMDDMENANRAQANAGMGMDVLLEGSFKATLDAYYRDLQPGQRKIAFFNPMPLAQLVRGLRDQKRQGYLDDKLVRDLYGIFWGTYSFAQACNGQVLVTMHLEGKDGTTRSFQAQGLPQSVMQSVAGQVFDYFQKTKFPSKVVVGNRSLELLGAPGMPVAHTAGPAAAERACSNRNARLPTVAELEYLAALGDYNGGVSLRSDVWALPGGMVYAPDLPNPSPVRSAEEVRGPDLHFYCVR